MKQAVSCWKQSSYWRRTWWSLWSLIFCHSAGKIHLSSDARHLLLAVGGFRVVSRGEVIVKVCYSQCRNRLMKVRLFRGKVSWRHSGLWSLIVLNPRLTLKTKNCEWNVTTTMHNRYRQQESMKNFGGVKRNHPLINCLAFHIILQKQCCFSSEYYTSNSPVWDYFSEFVCFKHLYYFCLNAHRSFILHM